MSFCEKYEFFAKKRYFMNFYQIGIFNRYIPEDSSTFWYVPVRYELNWMAIKHFQVRIYDGDKLCSRTFKNPERARLSQSEFLNPDGNLEPQFDLAKICRPPICPYN